MDCSLHCRQAKPTTWWQSCRAHVGYTPIITGILMTSRAEDTDLVFFVGAQVSFDRVCGGSPMKVVHGLEVLESNV
ncbi:hypothetical protein JTE90_004109 [Oedothorax gibbosus]|uniref:Uncharacterized protein n=1 Tax=Oedothorax gibbosus TaxID=931172 RepID=A0AAV6V1Z6_9ARAC|nr:hypothetical protein JTE90_004109 [Oedothorax gibbosus]